MRLLFLSEFFPIKDGGEISGGVESRSYYLAKKFSHDGNKVKVITAFLPGTKRYEFWGGLEIIRVGLPYRYVQSGSNLARLSFALASIIEGFKVDFETVDANNTATYCAASVLGKIKRKKAVFWVPDVLSFAEWEKTLGKFNAFINVINQTLGLISLADRYIALSESTKKKLEKIPGISNKIRVIYPGVNCPKSAGRKEFDVISVQRLTRYKRTDLVIEALSDLKSKGNKLTYRVIGEGAEMANLKQLVKDKNLTDQVTLLGNLPHNRVLEEMGKAKVFCLPSEIEGFGIVTLEAAALGVPFVNSDIPVHREIQKESQSGLLFKDGSYEDLAAKLEKLVKNKKEYARLSTNALDFARKHTLEKMAIATLKAYADR